jgi:hypothetical protein
MDSIYSACPDSWHELEVEAEYTLSAYNLIDWYVKNFIS